MDARTAGSLWILAVVSCAGPAQWRYEAALEQAPASAAHAIHEQRLTALMRDLDRLRVERLPKALDTREEERHQAVRIAQVARAMARSAALIPGAEPPDLDERSRAEFRALAERLQRRATALAEDAPQLEPDQRSERLSEIDATCQQCHGRFRIPGIESPGP